MLKKLDTRIRLALIYGSGREGRFCDKVAGWAISQIEGDGPFELAIIDPGTLELPPRHVGSGHPALEEVRQTIAWADGFIVVTPEYNRAYPAILKFLIDSIGPEWRGKPVGFVSYGASRGACAPWSSCGSSSANCTPHRSATASPSPMSGAASTQRAGSWKPTVPNGRWRRCWRSSIGGRARCGPRAKPCPTASSHRPDTSREVGASFTNPNWSRCGVGETMPAPRPGAGRI